MPTSPTQITVRASPEALAIFAIIKADLASRSPLPPRDSDIHRLIYQRGLDALQQEIASAHEPPR